MLINRFFGNRNVKCDAWLKMRKDKVKSVTLKREPTNYIIDFAMDGEWSNLTFRINFKSYGDALLWWRGKKIFKGLNLINECEINLTQFSPEGIVESAKAKEFSIIAPIPCQ